MSLNPLVRAQMNLRTRGLLVRSGLLPLRWASSETSLTVVLDGRVRRVLMHSSARTAVVGVRDAGLHDLRVEQAQGEVVVAAVEVEVDIPETGWVVAVCRPGTGRWIWRRNPIGRVLLR